MIISLNSSLLVRVDVGSMTPLVFECVDGGVDRVCCIGLLGMSGRL